MKDIYPESLPNGWACVIIGDGFRALLTAIKLNTKYPERVYLAGQLPRCSKYFFDRQNRWNLPKNCEKELALRLALQDISSKIRDEIPIAVPISDEYSQILKRCQNSLEKSFLTSCNAKFFDEGVLQ